MLASVSESDRATDPTSQVERTSPGSPRRRRLLAAGIAAVGAAIIVVLVVVRPFSARVVAGPTAGAGSAPAPDPAADEMKAGLGTLDPSLAAIHFQKALALVPSHYGATFQLARALDLAGRRDEAQPVWERVLRMAEQYDDRPVLEVARARLADPMKLGLEALYTKHDAVAAAARFREVLARNPAHYGATFQLATALDQANRPAEARPIWTKVLQMADAINDTSVATTARARLAKVP